MTDEEYIKAAKEQYESEGSIEIDSNAVVSHGDDPGAYVQAWVWVSDADRLCECGRKVSDCLVYEDEDSKHGDR